jgi:4Fe-4S ferredoxin
MAGDEQGSRVGEAPELNTEKARRAARHPDRPGEKCGADAGAFVPRIDRNSCEGKKDCVEVCPYDVFEVRRIDNRDFAELSFFGRLKSRAHGRHTAYTPKANLCQACGLCVVACPEQAITLVANPALKLRF